VVGVYRLQQAQGDRTPHQPACGSAGASPANVKPIYARDSVRIESWSKFISETYWNVPLEK